MGSTLKLPEELIRRLERRAVRDGRTPEDVAAELLAAGLPADTAAAPEPTAVAPENHAAPGTGAVVPKRLPLIKARASGPAPAEMKAMSGQAWADWLKGVEQQLEVERHEKALGHKHVDRAHG